MKAILTIILLGGLCTMVNPAFAKKSCTAYTDCKSGICDNGSCRCPCGESWDKATKACTTGTSGETAAE